MIDRIINVLERNNAFTPEDKEFVRYGLKMALLELVNVISIIFIGVLMGMVWESVIFLVVYIPLRSFVGGYHAKTELMCYLMSVLLVASILGIVKYFSLEELKYYILIVSCLVILFLSPVESKNKPLDQVESKRFRLISMILLFLVLAIWAFINLFSAYYGFMIIISLSSVSLLAFIGYLINSKS